MSDGDDLYEKLERLLLVYKQSQELELKKIEMTAKIANDLLEQNRKHQLELIQYFNQFVNPPKKD